MAEDPEGLVRVLQLIKGLGPGGAEQLLLEQARCRDRADFGYEVAYVVAEKDHLVNDLEAEGVEVTRLGPGPWPLALRRLLRNRPFDLVHAHSPLMAAAARVVTRTLPGQRRPGVVTTEHNRWPRHHRLTRALNRLTIGWDDATIAVSDDVRTTMPPGVPVESLVHGIDVAAVASLRGERAAVRAELGLADDEVVIGCVANFRPEKAHDVLLRAAAATPNRRFVLVGQGPRADEISRLHRELGLGSRVLMLGYRDDATRVLAGCDAFTLTSRHEGLPVALMEAMALGLPVVATRAGGIPQVVTHGNEALLADIDDVDGLARAYDEIGIDRDRREQMGRRAASAAEAFDVKRTMGRLESIYREVATV
ncbi:MAG: glycosyltransferase [Acidimicrobiales bacterium]